MVAQQKLFHNIDSEAERSLLIDAFFPVTFEAGAKVIEAGRFADNFYIVDSGSASVLERVHGDAQSGAPSVSLLLFPGDVIGHLPLVTNEPSSATVVARERMHVWALDRRTFAVSVARGARVLQQRFARFATQHIEVRRYDPA